MELTGLIGRINQCCRWVMYLIYLNFLWILFIALGLLLFGFFPATAALFATIRRGIREGFKFSAFQMFFSIYRNCFFKINMIGLFILFISNLIGFYIWLFSMQQWGVLQILGLSCLFIYLLILLYFFPVYAHYDLSLLDYLKHTTSIALLNWNWGVVMMMGLSIILLLFIHFPLFIIFFGMSGIALLLTSISLRVFVILEKRKHLVIE